MTTRYRPPPSKSPARAQTTPRRAAARCVLRVAVAHSSRASTGQQRLLPARQHGVDRDRRKEYQDDQRIHRRVVEVVVREVDLVADSAAREYEFGADDSDEGVLD